MTPYRIIKCPNCDQPLPNSARDLIAARVQRAATVNVRNPEASRNEMATDIAAAEDAVDPHAAPLVMLGQGENLVRLDLPRVDSTGMQGWFKHLAAAMGYGGRA